MSVRARSIFRGIVIDVKNVPQPQNYARKISITVRVGEVLKGSPAKTVTFVGNVFGQREARFNLWKKSKAEFLWFDFGAESLDASDPKTVRGLTQPYLAERWHAIRLSPPDPDERRYANYSEALTKGTFGMGMQVYESPREILAHVKKFLSDNPGNVPLAHFIIPTALAKMNDYDGGSNRLVIPVAPASEAILIKLIESPESVLGDHPSVEDLTWIRSTSVRVLSYFKSDKNIALLKSLLTDPGRGPYEQIPFTSDADRTYYWTRLAAYDVLTYWGITVPKPDL